MSEAPVDASTPSELSELDNRLSELQHVSYTRLIYLRFRKNKLAVMGLVALALMYSVALLAGFIAPYDPNRRFLDSITVPPHLPRFVDADGRFHLRPFFYKWRVEVDPKTIAKTYVLDKSQMYPLRLFTRGDEHKLLFFDSRIHLFGGEGAGAFLMGTDTQGRDLFSRIIYGGRVSTVVGLLGVGMSLVLGISIGMTSGYLGGYVDAITQRGIEVIRSFPTIPLWLALSYALPKYWSSLRVFFFITIILSFVSWTGLARVVRGMTLSLRHEEYVLSARMSGGGPSWIVTRHLLPANLSYVIVAATLSVPGMILGETALSFLGLGVRPPIVSWGVLLKDAQQLTAVSLYPWLISPVLFVAITVLAFNFVGDGLRDAIDPHSRY